MTKRLRTAALLLVLGASCTTPNVRQPAAGAQPGWGAMPSEGPAVTTVRAVEAALQPASPPLRVGKPGWGR